MSTARIAASLKALTPRAAHATGAAAVVLVLGTVYLVGIEPALDARRQARQAENLALAERADARRRAARVADALQTLRERRPTGDALPTTGTTRTAIGQLASLAEEHGLRVESSQAGPREEAEGLVRDPFRLRLRGRFAGLIALLADLDARHADVAVDGFSVSASQSADRAHSFQIDLSRYAAPHAARTSVGDGRS